MPVNAHVQQKALNIFSYAVTCVFCAESVYHYNYFAVGRVILRGEIDGYIYVFSGTEINAAFDEYKALPEDHPAKLYNANYEVYRRLEEKYADTSDGEQDAMPGANQLFPVMLLQSFSREQPLSLIGTDTGYETDIEDN